jgi:hypothetical protein
LEDEIMVVRLSGTQPQGPKHLETLENKTVLGSQNKIGLKSGNTANRTTYPVEGENYLNTETGSLEIFKNSVWTSLILLPDTVTNLLATNQGINRPYNNGQVSLLFEPGVVAGTSYTSTSNPGAITTTSSSIPMIITGLQSNTAYTFSVVASSPQGVSQPSLSSNSITVTTVPQSPTIGTATPGDLSATVSFTPGATGGSAITSHTITANPGNITASGSSSPITISGLTNGVTYTITASSTNANGTSLSSGSTTVTPISPFLINKSVPDLFTAAESFSHPDAILGIPTTGGTLVVNSVSLGSYDYVKRNGPFTVFNFSSDDWFTVTEDSRSAFVYIEGNLTINTGQVFRPSKRKLFTCIYVNGDLTLNGEISMTARGANHSTSGSNISPGDILIKSGIYSGVTNPRVPASGGSGGTGGVDADGAWGSSGAGTSGGAGTAGGTGGGAGGSHYTPVSPTNFPRGGNGSAGTSFSGGSGGGDVFSGYFSGMTPDAQTNGGSGGDSHNYYANSPGQNGGAGNPTGRSYYGMSNPGTLGTSPVTGTGGVLIIFVNGTLSTSGTGVISAQGASYGQASGGGSITVMVKTDMGPTPNASGIGIGGAGTARKLLWT